MASLEFRLSELERQLANLLRVGTVATIDLAAQRVTVRCGNNVTAPLPWFVGRAGAVRKWCPLSIGEQVMILSPGGDLAQGGVLPSFYSDAFPSPSESGTVSRTEFADGAFVEYDQETGKLSVSVIGAALVEVGGDAELTVTGELTVTAAAATINVDGAAKVTANVATVVASKIALDGFVETKNHLSVGTGQSGVFTATGKVVTVKNGIVVGIS